MMFVCEQESGRKGKRVKSSLRAGLVLVCAAGFCIALGVAASADVVDPASAYQPASTELVSGKPDGQESLLPSAPLDGSFFTAPSDEVVATPAPEQVVTQAPAHIVRAIPSPNDGTALDRAVRNVGSGFKNIGALLGRVASACQVGLATGTGGPVVVLAVLSGLTAITRRRALFARWATDEDVPELLYAWEITPPG